MTTIAYRNGVMAADTQLWTGGTASFEGCKIYRLADGSLFGASGAVSEALRYRDWLNEGGHMPRITDLRGLLVRKSGEVFVCEAGADRPIKIRGDYFSVGAGETAALGAMFAGASARRAILAAARHTQGTNSKVQTKRLHP